MAKKIQEKKKKEKWLAKIFNSKSNSDKSTMKIEKLLLIGKSKIVFA